MGRLCAQTGAHDVVDVSVVVWRNSAGHTVVTSDPEVLSRIDPELRPFDPVTRR